MDWEVYFENPITHFDNFVSEERMFVFAASEEEARAVVWGYLGRFGRIIEVREVCNLSGSAPEPVADGRGPEGEIDAKGDVLPEWQHDGF